MRVMSSCWAAPPAEPHDGSADSGDDFPGRALPVLAHHVQQPGFAEQSALR